MIYLSEMMKLVEKKFRNRQNLLNNFKMSSQKSSVQQTKTLSGAFSGDNICLLCGESFSKQFTSFCHCSHVLCSRCYNILNNIADRPPLCPICKK